MDTHVNRRTKATGGPGAPARFSPSRVNRVVDALSAGARSRTQIQAAWLRAVASRVTLDRPDLADALLDVLQVEPDQISQLNGLTIGEIGVCYEALLASVDRTSRKSSGQFFTPDDTAAFMAQQSLTFAQGTWLDPCCGVGNLSWHLAAAQESPEEFIRESLILIDTDPIALRTAVALISAEFAAADDAEAVHSLHKNSSKRDFLSSAPLPIHDFAIFNPPYARAASRDDLETGQTRDVFAYFTEKVAKTTQGFISVTPAAFLSAPKYQALRNVLSRKMSGGAVFAFDNVPDTLFRGYKHGSNNTSKTNFVRAAITVCSPSMTAWKITPIIRWQAAHRSLMFERCVELLEDRRLGPHGEWAKNHSSLLPLWDTLMAEKRTLRDIVVSQPTEYRLDVGLTPRYFISAAYRELDRASKTTLFFKSALDRDHAAVVLNSSIPYVWWRALDGGVSLPKRVLMSTPLPKIEDAQPELAQQLISSEASSVVVKHNAGRDNENVKHPPHVVSAMNIALGVTADLTPLYASSMFNE